VVEVLISDTEFETVLQGLEQDPGLGRVKFSLREVYKSAKMNDLLGIADSGIMPLLKRTHRLQFLRDTALCRSLDDVAAAFLLFLQHSAWKNVLEAFSASENEVQKLSVLVKQKNSPAVRFLKELCSIAQKCSNSERTVLYKALCDKEIIESLYEQIQENCDDMLLEFFCELCRDVIEVSPVLISEALQPISSAISYLAERMINSNSIGTTQELGRCIRLLISSEFFTCSSLLLDAFYAETMPLLIESLSCTLETGRLSELVFIFASCVEKHGDQARDMLLYGDLLERCCQLLESNSHAAIHGLRLVRTVAGKNDRSFNMLLVRRGVLDSLFHLLVQNAAKEGLLFSSALNLLNSFTVNSGIVLEYIVDHFVPWFLKTGRDACVSGLLSSYTKQQQKQAQ
jgi:hypothetical protein